MRFATWNGFKLRHLLELAGACLLRPAVWPGTIEAIVTGRHYCGSTGIRNTVSSQPPRLHIPASDPARPTTTLLTESLLIAAAGCVAGIAVGRALMAGLAAIAPPGIPRIDSAGMDWRVFVVFVLLAAATALDFRDGTRVAGFAVQARGRASNGGAWNGRHRACPLANRTDHRGSGALAHFVDWRGIIIAQL